LGICIVAKSRNLGYTELWCTIIVFPHCMHNTYKQVRHEALFEMPNRRHKLLIINWIGLSSVLRRRQHSRGYMGDGFYRSKDPNQQYQSTEGTYSTQTNQTYNNQTINTKHRKSPSLH